MSYGVIRKSLALVFGAAALLSALGAQAQAPLHHRPPMRPPHRPPVRPGLRRVRFEGNVDDRAAFHLRGMRGTITVLSGQAVTGAHFRFQSALPHRPVRVTLQRLSGRGQVAITEQPNPRNNYTASFRIYDPQPGRGHYVVVLTW